jgi:Nucleoside-diphosphate-sugar epimerases
MKKNILITGGLGHIGSAVLSSLKKNEFGKIIIIDNLLTQRFSSIFNKKNKINFQFYDYDISDDKIKSIFKEVDIVIHLAAITDATNSFNIAKEVKKINYFGSIKIIKICHKNKCKLIFPPPQAFMGLRKIFLKKVVL